MCVVPTIGDIIVVIVHYCGYGTGVYEGSTCECVVHVVSTMYVNNIQFVTLCHFIVTSYK